MISIVVTRVKQANSARLSYAFKQAAVNKGVGGLVTVYMAHNRKIGSSNIVGALLIPCTCCQAEIVNEC